MKKHVMRMAVTVNEYEQNERVVREVAIDASDVSAEALAAAIDALIFKFKHIYCSEEEN